MSEPEHIKFIIQKVLKQVSDQKGVGMGLNQMDVEDTKLARPVAVVDLWEIDDRVTRLEGICDHLEKMIAKLVNLYYQERVKNWTLILDEMIKQKKDRENGHKTS
jgi:hypothetical protein